MVLRLLLEIVCHTKLTGDSGKTGRQPPGVFCGLTTKPGSKHLGTLEKNERPSPYAQGVHTFIKRYTNLATIKGHEMSS